MYVSVGVAMSEDNQESHVCIQCQKTFRPKPKPIKAKQSRAKPPSKRPIAAADLTDDGNIPDNFKQGKTRKKVAPVDCPRQFTERVLLNTYTKWVEALCTDAKQRKVWSRPLARAFLTDMQILKIRYKDLCRFKIRTAAVPKELASRLFRAFRGLKSLKLKGVGKSASTADKK